ncbi:MAG: CPBP family intramembrane metalloprotease [Verrucomicrobia bacterium]|nr:CPBP family intramembrane metalloprotease [Verrucomicrobiota bacterium]
MIKINTLRGSRTLLNSAQNPICRGLQIDAKDKWACIGKTSTIGVGLIGSALAAPETFGIGVLAGTCTLFTSSMVTTPLLRSVLNPSNKQTTNSVEYASDMIKNPSKPCIIAPLKEELLCRFLLQDQILTPLIDMLSLPLPTPILATGIASLVFGSLHLLNGKDPTFKVQSINATGVGIAYGALYNEYGLLTTIVAHSMHNTLATSISTLEIKT